MISTQNTDTPQEIVTGKSLWRDAWIRLIKNKMAIFGGLFTLFMAFLAVSANWICPFDPKEDLGWLESKPPGYTHPAVKPWMRFIEKNPVPDIPWLKSGEGNHKISFEISQTEQEELWATLDNFKITQLQLKGSDQKLISVDESHVTGEDGYFTEDVEKFHDVSLVLGKELPEKLRPLRPSGLRLWRLILLRCIERPQSIDISTENEIVTKIITNSERSKAVEEVLNQDRFMLAQDETLDGEDKDGKILKIHNVTLKAGDSIPEELKKFKAFRLNKHFCKLYLTYNRTGGASSETIVLEILNRRLGNEDKIFSQLWSIQVNQIMPSKYPVPNITIRGASVKRISLDGRDITSTHYMGTDSAGRDLLSRVIYGGRISLLIGLVATIVSLFIGVIYGAVSGYIGGITDNIMMRIVDILFALPYMFLVILLLVFFGRDIIILFVALGCVQWLTMARIVRGQVLSLKEKEFIQASHTCGTGDVGIIFRHLIPNTLGIVAVYTTLTIPAVILQEAFLAFIGLGVQYKGQSLDSWGALTNQGMQALGKNGENWWLLLFPALILAITLLSLNFLGDGLRDALDPQQKGKT